MKSNIKKLFALLFLLPVVAFAENQTSMAYEQLKMFTQMASDQQKQIKMYSLMVNATRADVEEYCKNDTNDVCSIGKAINVKVTQAMVDAGFFFQPVGTTYTVPANSLTFEQLSNSTFDYKITLNVDTLYGGFTNDGIIETFQWDKNATIKSVGRNFGDFQQNMILKDGVLIYNGIMGTGNDKSSFSISMKQYDELNNGVEVKVTFKDSSSIYNMLAKADNSGGQMESSFIANNEQFQTIETFDSAGNDTGLKMKINNGAWIDVTPFDESAYSEYDLTESDAGKSSVNININNPQYSESMERYVVVKKDETPSEYNILGLGDFYDENHNGSIDKEELYFDYYGQEDLLGTSTTIDDDSLDVYKVILNPDGTESISKVDGIWLSK